MNSCLLKVSSTIVAVLLMSMASTILYQRSLITAMASSANVSVVSFEEDVDQKQLPYAPNLRVSNKAEIKTIRPTSAGQEMSFPPVPPSSSYDAQQASAQEVKKENSKPTFLLHIGPPKTGTTTLQCELGLKYPELASRDQFYYLGTWYAPLCGLPMNHTVEGFEDATRPVLLHCYVSHAKKGCSETLDKEWNDFAKIIDRHYTAGHNAIMSDEMFVNHFKEEDVKRLASILVPKWDVKIIYTYRHFYSSIPSMYHQMNDPYATQHGMANAYEKTIWPSEGGFKIPSFQNGNHFNIDMKMKQFQYWINAFGSVSVFDMHLVNGGNYLPDFFCTMMPQAPSLCETSRASSLDGTKRQERKDNDSSTKYLRYDMLAIQAKEEGLLDRKEGASLPRGVVRDKVKQYCEGKGWTTMADFPLDCLSSKEMSDFLDQSLKQARLMEPYFANAPQTSHLLREEIEAGFSKFEKEKQFCSVDTVTALQEEHWREFFASL